MNDITTIMKTQKDQDLQEFSVSPVQFAISMAGWAVTIAGLIDNIFGVALAGAVIATGAVLAGSKHRA